MMTSGASPIGLRVRDKAERILLDTEPGLLKERQMSIGQWLPGGSANSIFNFRVEEKQRASRARFSMRLMDDGDTRLLF
jgi:hypothetical protein